VVIDPIRISVGAEPQGEWGSANENKDFLNSSWRFPIRKKVLHFLIVSGVRQEQTTII